MFLILQTAMNGIFLAQDMLLFFIIFEATLIPMLLCIGIWGSKDRAYAAMKFFTYTFLGSALMLIAILYLGIKAGGFSFHEASISI